MESYYVGSGAPLFNACLRVVARPIMTPASLIDGPANRLGTAVRPLAGERWGSASESDQDWASASTLGLSGLATHASGLMQPPL